MTMQVDIGSNSLTKKELTVMVLTTTVVAVQIQKHNIGVHASVCTTTFMAQHVQSNSQQGMQRDPSFRCEKVEMVFFMLLTN